MSGSCFFDATVLPGGVVRSFRTHRFSDLDTGAVEALRPIVRLGEHAGPLELELPDLDGRPLPWLDWRRSGPDATFILKTSDQTAVTASLLMSGRGSGDLHLAESLSGLAPVAEPAAGDTVLAGVPRRPLLATRVFETAAVAGEEFLHVCARVEVVVAAAFFSVLQVGADEGGPS